MVDMVFQIANRSRTHTVSQAHTDDVLGCYTSMMAQSEQGWPDADGGGKRKPTTAEVIDWVIEHHLFDLMKGEVREYKRGILRSQFLADKRNVEDIASTVA